MSANFPLDPAFSNFQSGTILHFKRDTVQGLGTDVSTELNSSPQQNNELFEPLDQENSKSNSLNCIADKNVQILSKKSFDSTSLDGVTNVIQKGYCASDRFESSPEVSKSNISLGNKPLLVSNEPEKTKSIDHDCPDKGPASTSTVSDSHSPMSFLNKQDKLNSQIPNDLQSSDTEFTSPSLLALDSSNSSALSTPPLRKASSEISFGNNCLHSDNSESPNITARKQLLSRLRHVELNQPLPIIRRELNKNRQKNPLTDEVKSKLPKEFVCLILFN